jgi:hypothetical protein
MSALGAVVSSRDSSFMSILLTVIVLYVHDRVDVACGNTISLIHPGPEVDKSAAL